jgi:hypothetical protein
MNIYKCYGFEMLFFVPFVQILLQSETKVLLADYYRFDS